MFFFTLAASSLTLVSACAPELYKRSGDHPNHVMKRQNTPNVIADTRGWTFELSNQWNVLNENWGLCFNGTQQSPIAYKSEWGYSQVHRPTFNYPDTIVGAYNNWDFGPQFTADNSVGNTFDPEMMTNTDLPTMVFEENGQNHTVYFRSWHTHSPAEHTIDGWTPKAELHYVHYTAEGVPRAVIAFLIDRDERSSGSPFFSQLPMAPDYRTNNTIPDIQCNLNIALQEVNNYSEFWTYQGSLTTPPCYEGLRWFVAKDIIYMNDEQMQELLHVSTFSARPVQGVWGHGVNV